MKFEYDESKNRINIEKHGINFMQAQEIWQDEMMLEVILDFPNEIRYMCIGKVNNKYWTAIMTYRDEAIRLISVRRSRVKEIKHYENS